MVNFLFSLFNKDYCSKILTGNSIIREYVLPYENIKYGSMVKGNFYIRKTLYTYKYRNPFFGTFTRNKYSGLLHIIQEDVNGWKEEKDIILDHKFFDNDFEFLRDAYFRYEI